MQTPLGIPDDLIQRDLEVRGQYISLACGLTTADLPALAEMIVNGDKKQKAYGNSMSAALSALAEEEEEAELASLAASEEAGEAEVYGAEDSTSNEDDESYSDLWQLLAFLADQLYFAYHAEEEDDKDVDPETERELAAVFTDEPTTVKEPVPAAEA